MKEVPTVIKLRLKPEKGIGEILDGQSRIANWLYNNLLERANKLREEYKENPSEEISKTLYTKRGLRNLLPGMKKEHPFLKVVYSSPLKNTCLRLSETIQTYQKSRKKKRKGKKTGWPKFRSWKAAWFSLFYDEPGKGYSIKEGMLHLSLGMGEDRKQRKIKIPIQESKVLERKNIRNLRIVKQAGVFFAVFTTIREIPEVKPTLAIGNSFFHPKSFPDYNDFVNRIIAEKEPISQYLKIYLSDLLSTYHKNSKQDKDFSTNLSEKLNKLLEEDNFHCQEDLFKEVKWRNTTGKLISQNPKGLKLIKLKRMLLEDAYPKEIMRSCNIVALDPNHKNFSYAVDSDGIAVEIEAPKWLKIYDKRIDEIKSKRDRCKKRSKQIEIIDKEGKSTGKKRWQPSRRWIKYNHILEKALAKRRDQTKTFLFTLANRLFRSYDIVIIGDYTPHGGGISTGMRRAMNNRSLIGRFKDVLSWTAMKSGKLSNIFNERGTTRTCCQCGHVVKDGIDPNIRVWTCQNCQAEHIRDENASRNGLAKYLRILEKKGEISLLVPGSGLVSVRERWAWCVSTRGVVSLFSGGETVVRPLAPSN
ncbi:MAG: hypothetical protein DHS20C13_30940 [Thermodesulfobacteriota bacterium]|nr:MAG: hypothetical protein DHS20C13_30940 [Thermodesulfobacteriota bacterium]